MGVLKNIFPMILIYAFLLGQTCTSQSAGLGKTDNPAWGDTVANRFISTMRKRNYSFLTEDKLESLRQEIRDFITKYQPVHVSATRQEGLLCSIDRYISENFLNRPDCRSDPEGAYLKFRDLINTFKWKLWLALTRTPAAPEQLKRREAQRKWIREYIETVPIRPGDACPLGVARDGLRTWASAYLEQKFTDPLSLMYVPMTDKQFEVFKQWMKRSAANGLTTTVSDIPVRALGARAHNHADVEKVYSYPFEIQLPFEDEVTSIWGGGDGAGAHLVFASNALFRGRDVFLGAWSVFDVVQGSRRVTPEVRDDNPTELIAQWVKKEGKGDIAYNHTTVTLTALRGGKIAELNVANWFEADRVNNADLRKLIAEKGGMSISVDRLPPANGPRIMKGDKPRFFIVVQTHEKQLAVMDLKTREFRQVNLLSRLRADDSG